MRTQVTVPGTSTALLGPFIHNSGDTRENARTPSCILHRPQDVRTLNKSSVDQEWNREPHVCITIMILVLLSVFLFYIFVANVKDDEYDDDEPSLVNDN